MGGAFFTAVERVVRDMASPNCDYRGMAWIRRTNSEERVNPPSAGALPLKRYEMWSRSITAPRNEFDGVEYTNSTV